MFTRGAVAFVDYELLEMIDGARFEVPIVAIMDAPVADALPATVRALEAYPWLSHIVQAPLLSMERARSHVARLIDRLVFGPDTAVTTNNAVGRTALLAQASKRTVRFDRMRDFFEARDVSDRVIGTLVEVGEELVMNGLYDAPVEAGYFAKARQRIEDVELPIERACEISYGMDGGATFVRVRDTFGALKRARLIEVLLRCSQESVNLDESRGGAGLGLWRIFAAASTINITVVPGTLTDITISIGSKDSRRLVRPQAVDLFFAESTAEWSQPIPGDERFLMDQSITLLREGSTPTPSPC